MNFNKRIRLANEKFEAGETAIKNADYQRAADAFFEAANLFKGIKGQELNYAGSLANTANALVELDSYELAKKLFEKVIPIQKKLLGFESSGVADTLNNLANIYNDQGNYEQAKSLHEQALTIWRKILPVNYSKIAIGLSNLANIYSHQGNYEEAKSLHEQSLEIRQKVLPAEHPDIATSLSNLATIYAEQSNYEQAKSLYEQSLKIRQKVLPADHPDIATSLNNLAIICFSQGNYEQAKSLHEQALKIQEKVLPANHSDTATSLNNLANVYAKEGNYKQATLLYKQSLEIRQKVLPSDHHLIAASLSNLALNYMKLGESKKAKELQEQAVKIFGDKFDINHPDFDKSISNLTDTIIQTNSSDNSFTSIAKLHEAVFQLLVDITREENKTKVTPKQTFTLRTSKNDEQGRLSKGYWFLGDDESLYFSCWKGIDTTVQMPTIAIVIDSQQQVTLQFNGKDSAKKEAYLADLTKLLDGFSQFGDTHARWRKTYSQETWQQALEEFFTTDKLQIDEYLAFNNNAVEDLTPIPEKEFVQSLKFTLFLREKLKETASTEIRELAEVGKPLKLQSLQLENIGHFESVGFDLSRQITILIGENGSGKSTILKAIALGLSGKAKTLQVELIQDYLRILETGEDGTKHFCNKGAIHLNLQINTIQSQLIEFNHTELGGVDVETFVDNTDEWLLASEDRFIDLVLAFPQGKKRESKSFGKIVEPNLNDVLDLIEDRDISKWKADLVEWIVALYREPDAEIREKNLVQIQWAFDIISKIISDTEPNAIRLKSAVHNPATGEKDIIICTPDMPDGISLNLLSQGYTNIFIWVGRLIMRLYAALSAHQFEQAREKHLFLRNPNTRGKRYEANTIQELYGVVLIDEIDTYLHPQWQKNILLVLAKTFPNLQFIATTHSPLILSSFSFFDIEDHINGDTLRIEGIDFIIYNILKNQEDNKITAEVFNSKDYYPFASKISRVLKQMNVVERPKLIGLKLKQLDALIKAINKNNPSFSQADELVAELKEIIDQNDEDLVRLETVLKNKKILLK